MEESALGLPKISKSRIRESPPTETGARLSMMIFHTLSLADYSLFEARVPEGHRTHSSWCFANLICWRKFYRTQIADCRGSLVFKFFVNGGERVAYMPCMHNLAPLAMRRLVEEITGDAAGQPLRLGGLREQDKANLELVCDGQFIFDDDRDFSDYAYLSTELVNLPGRRFSVKRNQIRQFESTFDYCTRALDPGDAAACLALVDQLIALRTDDGSNSSLLAERSAIADALAMYNSLHLTGIVVLVEGRLAAFAYGSEMNKDIFCVHAEKADRRIRGSFAKVNQLLSAAVYKNYIYICREEDLGIRGLERAKGSYSPVAMYHKIGALARSQDVDQIIGLWTDCFGDARSFVESFMVRYYSHDRVIVSRDGDNIVSMLHIVPMECDLGVVGYIYAVCTSKPYRGRGLATSVVQLGLQRCRDLGLSFAILIPGSDDLRVFWRRFGFESSPVTLQFDSRFDFGTGRNPGGPEPFMIVSLRQVGPHGLPPTGLKCRPASTV